LVPGGIWDYPPADPTWPFLCLDASDEAPWDTFGTQGRVVSVTFSIFSTFQGRAEQFSVLDSLVRLLRHTTLTITGWTHVSTRHVRSQAVSPFEAGNERAGSSLVTFEIFVRST
jgi:hypothetical protein